jgi:hypothetical protein
MDLETKFKKETGLDAYMVNDLRPKIYRDYYVEWLEEKLTTSGVVGRSEQLKCKHQYMNAGTLQGHAMKKCLRCGDYVKAL